MKFLNNLLKSCPKISQSKGFTLAELLIAASLTSVIVGSSGWGLLAMLQQDIKAKANSTLNYDINRSVEFIAQEIRMAREIHRDAATAVTRIKDFTLPTGATPILVLRLNNGKDVVYYTQPASQPWGGDQVVVRWGPNFDSNGQYDTATLDQPSKWAKDAVVMDFIDDTPLASDQCPKDWQATHNKSTTGFYACVPTTGTTSRLVTFAMGGYVSHVVGMDTTYSVATNAFARSTPEVAITGTSLEFKCQDGSCTVDEEATLTVDVLGKQLTCGAGGDDIPVTTYVFLDQPKAGSQNLLMPSSQSLTQKVEAGTKMNLGAIARGGTCRHSASVSSKNLITPVRVVALVDGSPVPNIAPFANQSSIRDIIKPYIQNGKVKLEKNQVIYLFELGTNTTSSSAFDLQDLVILASLN